MPQSWLNEFEVRTTATLKWLERSVAATDNRGSAAYFHLWRGWSAAYPETTGYLIETLFDYAAYFKAEKWKNLALVCADWLCAIQHPDGGFPGGMGESGEPIVFDTGQILFGLIAAWKQSDEEKYRAVLVKAVHWLLENLEPDGAWRKFAYVPGYVPAYYTRVVWAVLSANEVLQDDEIIPKMRRALQFYNAQAQPNGAIKSWAFAPGEQAYTHTIAYTLRGFLECGGMLNDQDLLTTAQRMAAAIASLYEKHQKLAGSYDENWRGDYRFSCVTGDAQLAMAFARFFQISGEQQYHNLAKKIFTQTARRQWLLPFPNVNGAIPGSVPLWGRYQRFTFPNWAAKFYLDAYLILKKLEDEVTKSA